MKASLTIAVSAALASSSFAKTKKDPGLLVNWKDVPAAVQATIESNGAGGKVKEVEKAAGNGVLYYVAQVKGTDHRWMKVYVTEAGALMKVEADNARNKRKHKPLFG